MPVGSSRRGCKRQHKEMRKVVPKYRRFNMKTAAGRICQFAYDMDMTRQELAERAGVAKVTMNKYLITLKKVRVDMIDPLCDALAVNDAERVNLHRMAAIEAGYKIEAVHDSAH